MEKYSYSKIKCFLSCPFCFYNKYFERPEKDNPCLLTSHGMSEFGNFMHKILENYEIGELELYDLLSYYTNNYDKEIKSDFTLKMTEKFSKDFSKDYYDSGKVYLEYFEGFNDFKILEVEYAFEEIIKDFIFVGKIDLIAEDKDGNLIIIDHKSKSRFKNKAEKKDYARQLYLYAYAIKQKYNKYPKFLMFNMFRNNKWEVFDFNIEEYNDAINWLINMVKEIENTLEFNPVKNTFFCWNFCDYRLAGFKECKEGE